MAGEELQNIQALAQGRAVLESSLDPQVTSQNHFYKPIAQLLLNNRLMLCHPRTKGL
jgi:hypothetical protein